MKIDSVRYALVPFIPEGRPNSLQVDLLSVDEEDFKKAWEQFGHSSHYPKVELTLSLREDPEKIRFPCLNIAGYGKVSAIDTYSRFTKNPKPKTYVGWLIDRYV